jgi:hypothetical protein
MTGLWLSILGLGLVAALSPVTLVVFILVLETTRARTNSVGFLVGWAVSLLVVFGLCYAAGQSSLANSNNDRQAVIGTAEILLGALLALIAYRTWKGRKSGSESTMISKDLEARVARLRPWQSVLFGVLKQPWTWTALAAVAVLHDKRSAFSASLAFLVFAALSTSAVILMFVYFLIRHDEAHEKLEEIRVWLTDVAPRYLIPVLFVVAVILFAVGVVGLLSA